RRHHRRCLFDDGRAGQAGDQDDPHRVLRPCRSRRHRARGEPRATRWKCHGAVDHSHRPCGQGAGIAEASRAACDEDRRSLESHHALTATGVEGIRGRPWKACGPTPHGACGNRRGVRGGAFVSMTRESVGGFVAVASPLTNSQSARLAELALKHRLPGMFGGKGDVEAGGLMSYGPDINDLARRAAIYIDKILKGAKPAELPVEQASSPNYS